MNLLTAFKEELAEATFGITTAQAHKDGICIHCKEPITEHVDSKIEFDEYCISGLCGMCWTRIVMP